MERSKHDRVNTKSKQQPETTQLWYEAKGTHARDSQAESKVFAHNHFYLVHRNIVSGTGQLTWRS